MIERFKEITDKCVNGQVKIFNQLNINFDVFTHESDFVYNNQLDDIMKKSTGLIHGLLGAEVAKRDYGIDDEEIYDAIYYHTVGKPNMSLLTQIIYIADGIEPLRHYDGVDRIRELSQENLDKALILQIDYTIKSVLSKGGLLHTNTVDTRNYYLEKIR